VPLTPSLERLAAIAARRDFVWHQRFELAPDLFTPGVNDVGFLLAMAGIPHELAGASVLDIGTTNGGTAFMLERRGAARVVATDIVDDSHFGFEAIRAALDSNVEFRQASVYELPGIIAGPFDYVVFSGVLYHLRHPLLALDAIRDVLAADGTAYVETAVCDSELPALSETPTARFYRLDELGGDSSNWFAPNVAGLVAWCESCGLTVRSVRCWPVDAPMRAVVDLTPTAGPPEYRTVSYELPLRCSVDRG
jgi:tRNA (mo5U34)-methyltransferase